MRFPRRPQIGNKYGGIRGAACGAFDVLSSSSLLRCITLAALARHSSAEILVDIEQPEMCIFDNNKQELTDLGVCGQKRVVGMCTEGDGDDPAECGRVIVEKYPKGNLILEFEAGFDVCPDQMFLPLIPGEAIWSPVARLVIYFIALVYCFFGIAIVADIFMSSIEVITSQEKTITFTDARGKKREVTIKVWNETVANLTLMALGSSAPEILLALIETAGTLGKEPEEGGLGPGTIVGSAAFNLLAINAICVSAIPPNEDGTVGVRRVKDFGVFLITSFFSVFAYVWLFLCVGDEEVTVVEALITLLMFPLMVALAYQESKGKLFPRGKDYSITPEDGDMEGDESHIVGQGGMGAGGYGKHDVARLIKRRRSSMGNEDVASLAAAAAAEAQAMSTFSRMRYRIQATRFLTGGRRVMRKKRRGPEIGTELSQTTGGEADKLKKTTAAVTPEEAEVEFATSNYSIFEDASPVVLQVVRRGVLTNTCSVHFETRNGSATAGTDYMYTSGVLEFKPGQTTAEVSVQIVDDNEYEPDETFFVGLYRPEGCRIADQREAQVLIINDDCPGTFSFDKPSYKVKESDQTLVLTVTRTNGCDGEVKLCYATADGSAVSGKDYEGTSGELVFAHNEMSKTVKVNIFDHLHYEKEETFQVELTLEGGDGGGAQIGEFALALVHISNDAGFASMVDQVAVLMNLDADRLRIDTETWWEQVKGAMEVEGEDGEDAGGIDYFMHLVTFGWKVIFSLVPPTSYYNGWLAFGTSLVFVGILTAIVADIASLFGCLLGINDAVTAITFVALGTSLPDTFASKSAAIHDKYADASVGNVTGSNGVNVFLGLGLPWTMASIYYSVTGEQGGKYVVYAGSVGFSVAVFCPCAVMCLSILFLRRYYAGGALGGKYSKSTSVMFISLWCIYILMSYFETTGVIENPF